LEVKVLEELVLYNVKEGIATITLNRPESLNSLSFQTLLALRGIIDEIRADRSLRVVIITGSGSKAFCTGADLKERVGMTQDQVRRFIFTIRETFSSLAKLPIPVICAINGIAIGGGTELALACDLRLAADHAVLGLTEVSLGIIPGAGGTQRLPRLIGVGKAKELIFTGRKVSAGEALTIGMVNKVTTGENLLAEAYKLAAEMAANAPLAVRQAKLAINHGLEMDLDNGLVLESSAYEVLIPTKDRLEGLAAFKEKRKPIYLGE